MAVNLLQSAYEGYVGARRTRDVLHLAVSAGRLVHTLQIERGATAGFLQSKGQKFADVLPGIRSKSNANRSSYESEVAEPNLLALSTIQAAIVRANEQLAKLSNLRASADKLELSVADEISA